MFLKIFCVIFLLNYLCFAVLPPVKNLNRKNDFNDFKEMQVLRAPYFELPCMNIGGTCARGVACPPKTRVMQRGLCPQQQRLGMECCKPFPPKKKCSAKKGYCISKKYTCPDRIANDINDCLPTEVCCIIHGH